jgi:hypothetical protein
VLQLCEKRLRAALLAQLQASRSGSCSKVQDGAGSSYIADGSQGGPAARMMAAAAAECLAPALSEPNSPSGASAHKGRSAAEAGRHAVAVAARWPQPAVGWGASLQQVTACLPPLLPPLPPPPPLPSQTKSSCSQGNSLQHLGNRATCSALQHALAQQLLDDCVLGAVHRQVGASCTALR